MKVAGIDIGFSNMGISIFEVKNQTMEYLDSECFRSKKAKKSKDYVSLQDVARIEFIMFGTMNFLRMHNPELVIIELPTGGAKSSRAARALGIATCMCVDIPVMLKCKHIYVSPRDVKKITTGDENAEKDAIIKAVGILFPDFLKHKPWKHEHIADSIGCVMAKLKDL
jgi:Holliday junction resolvasome RuvABC endonuclease subunit